MRPSKFIFRTTNPDTNEVLLYNTLNGSLLAFDHAYLPELEFVLEKGTPLATESPLTRLLTEEEFLIADSYDEINMVLERNQLGITDENRLDVFIMPNMNCNFACPYCYEEHHKSKMSEDVQKSLIDWFTRMVPRFKAVLINWFGGEPLMSYGTIVTLQEQLIAICNHFAIPCISHITTNGYLLNPVRIHKLLDLGVTSYQITVDGAPENHNQTRILKDGSGTFERIFDNIVSLASDSRSKIRLRVNYDDKNINSIKKLLNILPQEIRARLELNCERIFGQEYGVFENDEINHGKIIAELYQYAFELGYDISQDEISPGKLTYCYADRMNQF